MAAAASRATPAPAGDGAALRLDDAGGQAGQEAGAARGDDTGRVVGPRTGKARPRRRRHDRPNDAAAAVCGWLCGLEGLGRVGGGKLRASSWWGGFAENEASSLFSDDNQCTHTHNTQRTQRTHTQEHKFCSVVLLLVVAVGVAFLCLRVCVSPCAASIRCRGRNVCPTNPNPQPTLIPPTHPTHPTRTLRPRPPASSTRRGDDERRQRGRRRPKGRGPAAGDCAGR